VVAADVMGYDDGGDRVRVAAILGLLSPDQLADRDRQPA
jgi:hypothetical protein